MADTTQASGSRKRPAAEAPSDRKNKTMRRTTTREVLRHVETSARHFWKATSTLQLQQEPNDKDIWGKDREMCGNEIITMALNEIAAHERFGFFMYIPNRSTWKCQDEAKRLPPSRKIPMPGASYPPILFMRYQYDEASAEAFFQDSHRTRYIKCNALNNLPPPYTPLYAIQYSAKELEPLFKTPVPSLVLIASQVNGGAYWLTNTKKLAEIVPCPPRPPNPKAHGGDAHLRLGKLSCLWQDESLTASDHTIVNKLLPCRQPDLMAVYNEIVMTCRAFGTPNTPSIPSTFTADELANVLPRPSSPTCGTPLGEAHVSGSGDGDGEGADTLV